jgi:hypothetical protein
MIGENWSSVSSQQIGQIAEYIARIEFAKQGFSICIPEVDDRGVDLLIHRDDTGYMKVQVKLLRGAGYVFMRKKHFKPAPDLALCFIVFSGPSFEMFFIPSTRWLTPCGVFRDNDYPEGKSAPEYGINLSRKNLDALRAFNFLELTRPAK